MTHCCIGYHPNHKIICIFYSESIFQRTYAIEYRGKRHELKEGGGLIIELPTDGKGGFFYMTAKGITFAFNLNTKVEWTEDSERRYHENVVSSRLLPFHQV